MRSLSAQDIATLQATPGYETRARASVRTVEPPTGVYPQKYSRYLLQCEALPPSNRVVGGVQFNSYGSISVDAAGKVNKCFVFGAGGASVYPVTDWVNLQTTFVDSVFYAAWLKFDTLPTGTNGWVFNADCEWEQLSVTNYEYRPVFRVAVDSAGTVKLSWYNGSNDVIANLSTPGGTIVAGQWFRVVAIREGGEGWIYVNGTQVAYADFGFSPDFVNPPDWQCNGANSLNIQGASCRMDDIHVLTGYPYGHALEDITKDYQSGQGAENWADLSTLGGVDWLVSASWETSADEPASTATLTLHRELDGLTLNSLCAGALTSGGAPVIELGRTFRIETATFPKGSAVQASDWKEGFRGRIDEISAADSPMSVRGRDLAGELVDTVIEVERVYSDETTGMAVESVMQKILDDNGFGAVRLYTPISPGWMVRKFTQKREPVLDALRALARQIGWEVAYRWDATAVGWLLTFFEPARAKTVSDWTWNADRYRNVKSLDRSIYDVRNFGQLIFSDKNLLTAGGTPTRRTITYENVASRDKYKRRWFEIAEASTSNIDTITEAQKMLEAAVNDLSEPLLDHVLISDYFWPAEPGDVYTLTANGVHYTSDQKLAVLSVKHEISAEDATTELRFRGKPCGAFSDWLRLDAGRVAPSTGLIGPEAPTLKSVVKTPTGFSATWEASIRGVPAFDFEVHSSLTSGFVPDSTTWHATVRGNHHEVSSLGNAATRRFVRILPRDRDGARGNPSAEVAFNGGYLNTPYVTTSALQPMISFGNLPLNGDFEAQNDTAYPPDNWQMHPNPVSSSGPWGVSVLASTDAYSGSRALIVPNGQNAQIVSDPFALRVGDSYEYDAIVKLGSGYVPTGFTYLRVYYFGSTADASAPDWEFRWLGYFGAAFSASEAAIGAWKKNSGTAIPETFQSGIGTPKAARLALVLKGNGGSVSIDAVSWRRTDAKPESVIVPALNAPFKSWRAEHTVAYRRYPDGDVQLFGLLAASSAPAAYSTIFTLPERYRTARSQTYTFLDSSGALREFGVNPDGTVVVSGFTAGAWLSLNGVRFSTEP